MEKQVKILASVFFVLVLSLSLASAMVVKSVDANNFQPGSRTFLPPGSTRGPAPNIDWLRRHG